MRDETATSVLDHDPPPSRWRHLLGWPTVLLLAWLALEVTTQPAWGVVIICLKFGWNDFHTALWLRRRDPFPPRGRACFWLYAASGLWKMALMGITLIAGVGVAVGVEYALNPPPPGQPTDDTLRFLGLYLLLIFGLGFFLDGLCSLRALYLAWRYRLRLWLSPRVHAARRAGRWPPLPAGRAGLNFMELLLLITFSVCLSAAVILGIDRLPLPAIDFALVVVAAILAAPVVVGLSGPLLYGWAVAKSPHECWATPGEPDRSAPPWNG